MSFDTALAAFASLPSARAQYDLARPTFFYLEANAGGPESLERTDVRDRLRRRIAAFSRQGTAIAEQLLDDPAAVQARVAELLDALWRESFAAEWTRLEPLLAAEVEQAQHEDPVVLLGSIRSELKVDAP
jgi:hypothetical protein